MSNFLQGIDTVIVRVSDLETSKKWYTEKLELGLIWEDQVLKLVVLDTGGPTSITLWQTSDKITVNKNTASYPIFKTLNAAESRKALVEKGIITETLVTDHAVTYFHFFDPDGNLLEACQVHG